LQHINIPSISLLSDDLGPSFTHIVCERRQRRLHPHFDSLKRTERQIRDCFSSGRRTEENNRLIRIGEQLLAVEILEDFVESIFARALTRVSNERRRPAKENAAKPGFTIDGAPAVYVRGVDFGVDLAPALDKVEGSNGCVGWTAGWERLAADAIKLKQIQTDDAA
jgi:hypothetical protein